MMKFLKSIKVKRKNRKIKRVNEKKIKWQEINNLFFQHTSLLGWIGLIAKR